MPQTVARGQISFIDLNDGKSISLYLTSNRPTQQLYDVDLHTYTPNYQNDNLVITPMLYVSGETGNQVSRIAAPPTWKINGAAISSFSEGVSAASSSPYALTISKNALVNSAFMVIECELNYIDPNTGLSTAATAQITFTKVDTTGELIRAIAYAMDKNVFHNDIAGNQSCKLHADMWRGSDIDNTQVAYAWFRKDNPNGADVYDWHKIVTAFSGAGGAAATGTFTDGQTWIEVLAGGIKGWDEANSQEISAVNVDTIVVHSDDIVNYDAFMCVCTDTDNTSATANTDVRSETITIVDWTDPFYLDFVSPNGTTLTSGTTSLSTTVEVWQNGAKLADSAMNAFYYLWTKSNKNGVVATGVKVPGSEYEADPDDYKAADNAATPTADTNWYSQSVNGVTAYCHYATGASARQLTVYKNEIAVKNNFFVEVIIP